MGWVSRRSVGRCADGTWRADGLGGLGADWRRTGGGPAADWRSYTTVTMDPRVM